MWPESIPASTGPRPRGSWPRPPSSAPARCVSSPRAWWRSFHLALIHGHRRVQAIRSVLDEPTLGLDIAVHRKSFYDEAHCAERLFQGRSRTIIVSTHQVEEFQYISPRGLHRPRDKVVPRLQHGGPGGPLRRGDGEPGAPRRRGAGISRSRNARPLDAASSCSTRPTATSSRRWAECAHPSLGDLFVAMMGESQRASCASDQTSIPAAEADPLPGRRRDGRGCPSPRSGRCAATPGEPLDLRSAGLAVAGVDPVRRLGPASSSVPTRKASVHATTDRRGRPAPS